MRFTLKTSGSFVQQLQERMSKLAAEKAMGACIKLPEALHFIWWQEFGTPARVITPVEAKMLAFPGEGGTEIRDSVNHPGIRAHHTVHNSLDEIRSNTIGLVRQALHDGAASDLELLREVVVEATHEAKAIIAGGLASDLPGIRKVDQDHPKQSGKLLGETASSVFTDLAEITEVSE